MNLDDANLEELLQILNERASAMTGEAAVFALADLVCGKSQRVNRM